MTILSRDEVTKLTCTTPGFLFGHMTILSVIALLKVTELTVGPNTKDDPRPRAHVTASVKFAFRVHQLVGGFDAGCFEAFRDVSAAAAAMDEVANADATTK